MVILKRPSYVHELNEAYWQRTRLGWCLLQRVHESLCYHVVRVRVRGQIRPSAIVALAVGWCMAPDLRGSGYVGPQHVFGMWAAAPSRLRASVRGFDVIHECYYV